MYEGNPTYPTDGYGNPTYPTKGGVKGGLQQNHPQTRHPTNSTKNRATQKVTPTQKVIGGNPMPYPEKTVRRSRQDARLARTAIAEFVDSNIPRFNGWLQQVAEGIPQYDGNGEVVKASNGSTYSSALVSGTSRPSSRICKRTVLTPSSLAR